MTGHRTVVIRRVTLRRSNPKLVMVREIVLWQRTDVVYQIAITTHAEDEPGKATINDYEVGPTRAEAIAAFEETVADSRREGFSG